MKEQPQNTGLVQARSREEIFTAMHRQLRTFNPEVPESPDRLDPVLRILMQLFSHQLSQIDNRIDNVWDVATSSLIRSMLPDNLRWPVPAYTVMRAEPLDPSVDIDPHTRFYYKERREGGQTFFFAPLRHERIIKARVARMFLGVDDLMVDLSPQTEDMTATSAPRTNFRPGDNYHLYVAVEYDSGASDFLGTTLFLSGAPEILKQLRWGRWYPGSGQGGFYEDSGFCPGLTGNLETMYIEKDMISDWGGLRTSAELFKPLEHNFVSLPDDFVATWERGLPGKKLKSLIKSNNINLPDDQSNFFWLRVDLPPGGDKSRLQTPFEMNFSSFVVVNKNELTLFKHTGGGRLIDIELPEDIDHILEINSVVDSSGREYVPRHQAGADSEKKVYAPEERGNKLVLWFDFSTQLEMPPDSVTVNYSVTASTEANGIAAGKIDELYEAHPGIAKVVNVIPTNGAVPAKTNDQILSEVSARLRNRDRSLNFGEIVRWAKTFDPRVRHAECSNGVEKFDLGVRRCIIIKVSVRNDDFYSDDEIRLLQTRLGAFLKSRAPVNTQFKVEIIGG